MGGLGREVRDDELASAVIGNAFTSTIGALFSATPTGMFGQNSALIANTKIISRFVLAIAGISLFLCGISPVLANLIRTIPPCVVGGATLVIFSILTTSGLKIVGMEGFTQENNMILGLSMAAGVGLSVAPQVLDQAPYIVSMLLLDSTVVSGAIVAMLLQGFYSLKLSRKNNRTIEIEKETKSS